MKDVLTIPATLGYKVIQPPPPPIWFTKQLRASTLVETCMNRSYNSRESDCFDPCSQQNSSLKLSISIQLNFGEVPKTKVIVKHMLCIRRLGLVAHRILNLKVTTMIKSSLSRCCRNKIKVRVN